MARRHVRLVPEDAIEAFEIRIVHYFNPDGEPQIVACVEVPDKGLPFPPKYEVLGILEEGKDEIKHLYETEEEDA